MADDVGELNLGEKKKKKKKKVVLEDTVRPDTGTGTGPPSGAAISRAAVPQHHQ